MMTNHGNRLTQGQFSFLPDLTDQQIELLAQWIDQGAVWPVGVSVQSQKSQHWSFQPIARPPLPRHR